MGDAGTLTSVRTTRAGSFKPADTPAANMHLAMDFVSENMHALVVSVKGVYRPCLWDLWFRYGHD
jgi:hypothetical protein